MESAGGSERYALACVHGLRDMDGVGHTVSGARDTGGHPHICVWCEDWWVHDDPECPRAHIKMQQCPMCTMDEDEVQYEEDEDD